MISRLPESGTRPEVPGMVRGWGAIAMFCAGASLALAEEACVQRPGRHFEAGVAHHLARNGIAHRASPDRGVCVADGSAAALDAAVRQVERHYWEVARLVGSACEEAALVEWAGREKLRFEVTDVVDLARKPAGRMFHLRSFDEDEVAFHRRKLEEAPKSTCFAMMGGWTPASPS